MVFHRSARVLTGFSDLAREPWLSSAVMNFQPTDSGATLAAGSSLPAAGRAQFGQASSSALGMKWSALHDAAGVVATHFGLGTEVMTPELRSFPAVMRDACEWRRTMAEQGVEDITVFMEPALSALLAVQARGANPAAPAQALWQEFTAARDALLALRPPQGEAGAMRFT
jgi:hypothetical protein